MHITMSSDFNVLVTEVTFSYGRVMETIGVFTGVLIKNRCRVWEEGFCSFRGVVVTVGVTAGVMRCHKGLDIGVTHQG